MEFAGNADSKHSMFKCSVARILTHSKLKNTYFWRQTWMLYIQLIMSVSWKKNPQDHEIWGVGRSVRQGFFLQKNSSCADSNQGLVRTCMKKQ